MNECKMEIEARRAVEGEPRPQKECGEMLLHGRLLDGCQEPCAESSGREHESEKLHPKKGTEERARIFHFLLASLLVLSSCTVHTCMAVAGHPSGMAFSFGFYSRCHCRPKHTHAHIVQSRESGHALAMCRFAGSTVRCLTTHSLNLLSSRPMAFSSCCCFLKQSTHRTYIHRSAGTVRVRPMLSTMRFCLRTSETFIVALFMTMADCFLLAQFLCACAKVSSCFCLPACVCVRACRSGREHCVRIYVSEMIELLGAPASPSAQSVTSLPQHRSPSACCLVNFAYILHSVSIGIFSLQRGVVDIAVSKEAGLVVYAFCNPLGEKRNGNPGKT